MIKKPAGNMPQLLPDLKLIASLVAVEVARNLKAAGVVTDLIMQATGLSREEIETLH
jgi:hypothetical protein